MRYRQINSVLIDGHYSKQVYWTERPPVGTHSGRFGANFDPSSKAEGRGLSAQFDLDLGSTTFTSISAYRENDFMASADVDFLPVDILIGPVDYEFETFSQEFQQI